VAYPSGEQCVPIQNTEPFVVVEGLPCVFAPYGRNGMLVVPSVIMCKNQTTLDQHTCKTLKEKKLPPDFSKFDFRKSYRLVKKGHTKMMERIRSRVPLCKIADRSENQTMAVKVGTAIGIVDSGSQVAQRPAVGV
jgi:hypothetical protein